jgi:hypothetical protein
VIACAGAAYGATIGGAAQIFCGAKSCLGINPPTWGAMSGAVSTPIAALTHDYTKLCRNEDTGS